MVEQARQPTDPTFRAYVWCPMNNGQMLIEFNYGDTIKDLLQVVRQQWGIKLPTVNTRRGEMWAGWNVLGQAEDGTYIPLHVDDRIPRSPQELGSWMEPRFEPKDKGIAKTERNHNRWIISHGLEVNVDAPDSLREFYKAFDKMIPAENLEWPHVEDSANIKLCIVTAIAGG